AVLAARIGDIGGNAGALQQSRAVAVVGRTDLLDGPRQAEPVGAVVGGERDDLAEDDDAVAHVVLLKRGVGVLAQLRKRLVRPAGVVLDLGFELDRGFVEVGALVSLVGGGCGDGNQGNGRKGDERGNQASAEWRTHGFGSSSPRGGKRRGGDNPSTIPNHVPVVAAPRRRFDRV